MAQYTGKDTIVSFNGHDVTQYLLDNMVLGKAAMLEDISAFGQEDQRQGYSGRRSVKDFPVGGLYDSTATTGSDAVFNAVGTSAALVVTVGGAKVWTGTALVKDYDRIFNNGKITRFKATLAVTGTWTDV